MCLKSESDEESHCRIFIGMRLYVVFIANPSEKQAIVNEYKHNNVYLI